MSPTDPVTQRAPRRRLSSAQRRQELVDSAAQLFGAHPVDQVSMEEIAHRAGASRALLYRYFPAKQHLLRAVAEHEISALHTGVAGSDLRGALSTYVNHVQTRPVGYRLLHEGALGQDLEVQAQLEDSRRHLGALLLRLSDIEDPTPATRLALEGWMGMAIAVCIRWSREPVVPSQAVVDLLERALRSVLDHPHPSGVDTGPAAP